MKQETGLGRFVSFDNYLPEEIIKEILLRLDIKSLRRIECVCKSWQTLIRQPSFINNHLKRQPPSVLLIGNLSAKPSYDSLINDFDFLASCRSDSLDHGVQRYDFPPWLIVESSDNGVLLLSDVRKTFYDCLWNPATGELKTLPSPSTCLQHCTIIIDLLGLG
ncbi:hypothetical protein TIFTF001_022875 [Ficus carica]|uniref:F-box domain-containing protein n=1 Tax=Ficus carica TaxID=3494 RepID=A0AA88DD61_FICCA|nr:hypothetical protein TIFTF001_022875 [Ficus carica]